MFPTAPLAGTTKLPHNAKFWMPEDSEIDSESGIGYFRDTWLIRDLDTDEANELIFAERCIADQVGQLASDEDHFELLASLAESASVDDPAVELDDDVRGALAEVVSDIPELRGLELGVAGLVYALATTGIIPAASCRSHPTNSWAEAPVVLFAASRDDAEALEKHVGASGCTFVTDDYRPDLLVVRGRSIQNTMALAASIMNDRRGFTEQAATRSPDPISIQPPLF